MARSKRFQEDLTPYHGCDDEALIGLAPLAVGFLQRGQDFATGKLPADLAAQLAPFCRPELTVCPRGQRMACPLCGERITIALDGTELALGAAEIRVLGAEDIFAAPDLVVHYITAHNYRPPDEFVTAVRFGSPAGAPEHRALINTLR